jgi:hypothetical protein
VQKEISLNHFEKCVLHEECLEYYELNKEMPTLHKLLFIKKWNRISGRRGNF